MKKKNKINKQKDKSNTVKKIFYIPLFTRFKAFIIDSFLITIPILYIVIYLIIGSLQEFAQQRSFAWSLIIITHLIIIILFWIRTSQTPGMKAYNLLLVNNTTNKKISLLQVLLRYFTMAFTIFTFFLLFIPFFRKDKKTFYDILSNSTLIYQK